jgi:hypothetical protein
MSEDSGALLALKHAWRTAVVASDSVRALEPAVQALEAAPAATELAAYHRAVLAESIAVMALRSLLEDRLAPEPAQTAGEPSLS